MGEYWDELPEAHFEVDIRKHTHVFVPDDDLTARLDAIAKNKHVPSERLINGRHWCTCVCASHAASASCSRLVDRHQLF
jgi:hypothetical protein